MGRSMINLSVLLLVLCFPVTSSEPAAAAAAKSTPPSGAVSSSTNGMEYFVAANDPGASNDNNGLSPVYRGGRDGPWLTIQRAADSMTAGDVAYIRGGTYYESGISFAHGGTPGAPVTLANYQSEEVFIDGSRSPEGHPGIRIAEGRDHCVIRGLTIRNMSDSGIATDEEASDPFQNITIRDCILHDNGWSGIHLAAVDGFVVDNVEAHDNAYYGLNIAGSEDGELSAANGVVRNSSFYNHTGEEGHGLAINQGHDIAVTDCAAYHNTVHGFDVSDWPKYGELSYNITFEGSHSYDNGVAGFAVNSDSHHVVYRNNVAWGNGAAWAGRGNNSGFWCYEGCWHVEWYNNVSLENAGAGFYVQDQPGVYGTPQDTLLVFKNNIAYENGRPEWNEWRHDLIVEGEAWELIATHNDWGGVPGWNALVVAVNMVGDEGDVYTRDEVNNGAFQTGNISDDPRFLDAAAPDVRLRSDSPCIDAGVDVGMPYLGLAPDMGAFEFAEDEPIIVVDSDEPEVSVSFKADQLVRLNCKAEQGEKIWVFLRAPTILPGIEFIRPNDEYCHAHGGRYVFPFANGTRDMYYVESCNASKIDFGPNNFAGLGKLIVTTRKGDSAEKLETIQIITLAQES